MSENQNPKDSVSSSGQTLPQKTSITSGQYKKQLLEGPRGQLKTPNGEERLQVEKGKDSGQLLIFPTLCLTM